MKTRHILLALALAAATLPVIAADAGPHSMPVDWEHVHEDSHPFGFALIDRLEYRGDEGPDHVLWDAQGWYGGDYNRLWIKTEGEQASSHCNGEFETQALYGRPIRHILLLHAGEFTASLLDSLLLEYEALGVRFISLEYALDDPAYANPPEVTREYGMPFLTQVALEREIASPAAPAASSDSLEALCASAPTRWAGASGPGPR